MLNEMKYVYAVYQEKSFSKAARKLQVSQPALSKMVRKVEKDIGVIIFDRSTIPVTVTREGAFYIKSIEDIMFIQRNLKSYFMDLKNLNTGNLSLGGSSFFCSFVFPGLIGRFREKYPNVVINLMEGNVGELREGLENETVDLVIETATDVGSNIERFFYNHEKIILAVPTRYQVNKRLQPYRLSYQDILTGRFADSETEEVPLYELREVPFITMKPGNDMYQRSSQICRNACVSQMTFHYNEKGETVGDCRASRMIYVTTRGGYTGVMPSGYPNLAVKYLKAFCQMLGIARFDSVEAEGLDIYGNDPEEILKTAQRQADRLLAELLSGVKDV